MPAPWCAMRSANWPITSSSRASRCRNRTRQRRMKMLRSSNGFASASACNPQLETDTIAPVCEEANRMTEIRVVSNATCTFCGCVCDDMELTVEGDRITKAKNACGLGKAWFLNHHVEERPVAVVDGKPANLDDAVERAARILAGARYPIVYGLSDTTCEAQR